MAAIEAEVRSEVEQFVGANLDAFERDVSELGYSVRIVKQDGALVGGKFNYDPNRLNVVVADGQVVEINSVG